MVGTEKSWAYTLSSRNEHGVLAKRGGEGGRWSGGVLRPEGDA